MSEVTSNPTPYVYNQIIIFGHPARIDMMLGTQRSSEKQHSAGSDDDGNALLNNLRLMASVELEVPVLTAQEEGVRPTISGTRELRLYRVIEEDDEVYEAVLRRSEGFEDIIVERNYLLRGIPWTAGGSPWTAGGSPWTAGGSPWTAGGSPWTAGGSPWTAGGSPWTAGGSPWLDMADEGGEAIRLRAERLFKEQWAFGPTGVDAEDILNKTHFGKEDGEDVVVGIFDTSPFPVPFTNVTLTMPPTPLELILKHPIPGGTPGGCIGFVGNHGLFVAGLVHAISPKAEIQLIRVLDDAAQGTLFNLVTAIYEFVNEQVRRGKRAVINLSLGLHGSDHPDEEDWDGPDLLRDALERAYALNIVTVAAAGNENGTTDEDLPAEFPARWRFVLGVAASDIKKRRACFSNQGDVMAPGGAGLKYCRPPIGHCSDESCPYMLISLSVGSYTGYGYGVGTSFAAPLVSGIAARLMARLDTIDSDVDLTKPGVASATVIHLIKASAASNDGVVKVT